MLKALLIFALGLMPPLLSVWMMRSKAARTQNRLRAASNSPNNIRIQTNSTIPERYYLEGVGYLIGDISCKFNARSGYLRCAVNPQGPCANCRYYEQTK
ncbi:DUF6464 family protein [Aliterella atlantica]|uniref:Uncharacterized protein n=1 Tax=Aliterella atlantica CENA595 TaxID=1618023 RepID=A0A0D8ZVG4_9CYAN|nr:DUF6464 family protein [Aliterella atlantica]KJH72382.1 hypothetical protein UH38_08045 [Aliterella atlantica CENA595]